MENIIAIIYSRKYRLIKKYLFFLSELKDEKIQELKDYQFALLGEALSIRLLTHAPLPEDEDLLKVSPRSVSMTV